MRPTDGQHISELAPSRGRPTLHGSLEAGQGGVQPEGVAAGPGFRDVVHPGESTAVEQHLQCRGTLLENLINL